MISYPTPPLNLQKTAKFDPQQGISFSFPLQLMLSWTFHMFGQEQGDYKTVLKD